MTEEIGTEGLLIREGIVFHGSFRLESMSYSDDWKIGCETNMKTIVIAYPDFSA